MDFSCKIVLTQDGLKIIVSIHQILVIRQYHVGCQYLYALCGRSWISMKGNGMRWDRTTKTDAIDKDVETSDKLGILTAKSNTLQKSTSDDWIVSKFNQWNTFKTNIKLSSTHLTTVQNDHALPIYSRMFHKSLNTFLNAMIVKGQALVNNLAGQYQ